MVIRSPTRDLMLDTFDLRALQLMYRGAFKISHPSFDCLQLFASCGDEATDAKLVFPQPQIIFLPAGCIR